MIMLTPRWPLTGPDPGKQWRHLAHKYSERLNGITNRWPTTGGPCTQRRRCPLHAPEGCSFRRLSCHCVCVNSISVFLWVKRLFVFLPFFLDVFASIVPNKVLKTRGGRSLRSVDFCLDSDNGLQVCRVVRVSIVRTQGLSDLTVVIQKT